MQLAVGDKVRVTTHGLGAKYGEEFTITNIVQRARGFAETLRHDSYAAGDRNGSGVWLEYLELVTKGGADATLEEKRDALSNVMYGHGYDIGSYLQRTFVNKLIDAGVTIPIPVKPELPTEPGLYVEKNSTRPGLTAVWSLAENGYWISGAGSRYDNRVSEFLPLVKLVPEEEK